MGQNSFVPDIVQPTRRNSFEPDDAEPTWLERIWPLDTSKPFSILNQERMSQQTPAERPDRNMYDPEFGGRFTKTQQNMADIIAMSKYLPEWAKPGLSTTAAWLGAEIPRTISHAYADPTSVLTPGLLKAFTRGPEVLPLLPQKSLPLPREGNINPTPVGRRFVGGPIGGSGEVLQDIDIIPELGGQGEARLMTPNNPPLARDPGRFTDLDEVREAERLKNVFYTGHEQAGGTSLEIPESARQLRSTELGVEEASRAGQPLVPGDVTQTVGGVTRVIEPGMQQVGDARLMSGAPSRMAPRGAEPLPYPLNVVPEHVRPRSAQAVTQALAGEQPPPWETTPAAGRERITFENEPVPQRPQLSSEAPTPSSPLLPSAIIKMRNASKNSGLDISKIAANAPPELQPAVQALVDSEAKTPRGWNVYDRLGRQSDYLRTQAIRSVQITRQYLQAWVPDLENAINKMTKEQKQNFGAYVEGTLPVTSPAVQRAVDVWRRVESAIGDKATDIGLRLYNDSKNWVPFMKNTNNYWPHIPIEQAEEKLLDRLVNSGMSVSEAKKVVNYYRKTGEIVIGAQHARQAKSNIPYRLDSDAAIAHVYSMAKRISQHEHFGPMDIAGKGAEGIADIIKATPDRNLTNKLMERLLGREDVATTKYSNALNYSRKFAAIFHLQNFAIPNMILGNASTAQKAGIYWTESLKELTKLVSKRYRQDLATSGAWQSFQHTLAEEVANTKWPNGISWGEVRNRAIAAAVGKAVAKSAHAELRQAFLNQTKTGVLGFGTKSKIATAELKELVLEDVNKLIRQDKLTDAQLRMAAGRMAERTQGLNVPGNLPYDWSTPANDGWRFGGQVALIFKKMGYQATKAAKDSIDPRRVGYVESAKAVARWMAVAAVAGELVGDTKAGLRDIWSPRNEQDERIQRWLEGQGWSPSFINMVSRNSGIPDYMLARLADNWSQAFFLGLPADLYQGSTYGPQGLLSAIGGPVLGDISKAAYYIGTGNMRGAAKEGTKMIPIPGSQGLAERWFPSDR